MKIHIKAIEGYVYPRVRAVTSDHPAWRHGMLWGLGEGVEWVIGFPTPFSIMLRSENELFDSNHYAARVSVPGLSIFVRIDVPWLVKHRIMFLCVSPYRRNLFCPRTTAYLEWGRKFITFFPLKVRDR